LVDTDVFSYLLKGHTLAEVYKPHVQGKVMALSFVTVGELQCWAIKRNWGVRKIADLNSRLRSAVIVPYDFALCETYGKLRASLEIIGKTVADNDLWIAACAIRHSIPLVSNNRSHFSGIPDLVLISEAPIVAEITSQADFQEIPGFIEPPSG
jgi:predicted nucleic acid-binding protein